ncbi:HNH endonuclease [Enterobacter sp. RHB15-C17]|nr:HNH endonuclease [Enterobacter sp. RHB15-C17]
MAKKSKSKKNLLAKAARMEERAKAQKVMSSLNLTMGHYKGGVIYDLILRQLRAGLSFEQTQSSVRDSNLLEEARQGEAKIQQKLTEQRLHARRMNEANKAFNLLNITHRQHRGTEIWDMAKGFAKLEYTSTQILERLQDHPVVQESRSRTREIREEHERIAAEKHEERLRTRVDMRDVLKYLAEKNGRSYTPPAIPETKHPKTVSETDKPLQYKGTVSARLLGGKPSTSTENPRTYDLPNMPNNARGINTVRLADARALVGVRYADFLKYHIHHKDNGLNALEQAKIFMKQFAPAVATQDPANDPAIFPDVSNVNSDKIPAVVVPEPVKRTWSKEEKRNARDKAQDAAREARYQSDPQHIIDPVIVNGTEYRSTWHAMESLAIGEDADARRFRREIKVKGEAIWTYEGEQYRFELKNKRPQQITAIQEEEQDLIDIELKASGRVAEVFLRDPRAQAVFRKLVLENFGERCAVSRKHLGGVLEAAHIEGAAVDGCYNASNGVLLSPTFHKLYDRHLMGINPESMTVHFASGIEWEEYEGIVITPLRYRLDKARLAARWAQFKGKH